jgi:hypothetical protein
MINVPEAETAKMPMAFRKVRRGGAQRALSLPNGSHSLKEGKDLWLRKEL